MKGASKSSLGIAVFASSIVTPLLFGIVSAGALGANLVPHSTDTSSTRQGLTVPSESLLSEQPYAWSFHSGSNGQSQHLVNDDTAVPPKDIDATDNGAIDDDLPALLDDEFDEWLSKLAGIWSIKGIGIAVVRKRPHTNASVSVRGRDDWVVETKGYGIKNGRGDPVANDVCHRRF